MKYLRSVQVMYLPIPDGSDADTVAHEHLVDDLPQWMEGRGIRWVLNEPEHKGSGVVDVDPTTFVGKGKPELSVPVIDGQSRAAMLHKTGMVKLTSDQRGLIVSAMEDQVDAERQFLKDEPLPERDIVDSKEIIRRSEEIIALM